MLISLEIQNIALIEHLSIEFADGLNILTGETGAGKSIIIDGVNLALGGRADKALIRTGCERARVQALFDVGENEAALAFLREQELEQEDGVVSVGREITSSGRSVCRIAGQIVPLSALKGFTSLLVDVHGQHEHQSLFDEKSHVTCIDAFAAQEIAPLKDTVQKAYGALAKVRQEIKAFAGSPQQMAQRADMLAYQVKEISQAHLSEQEEETLLQKRDFFKNREKIASAVLSAREALDGTVLQDLRAAAHAMGTISDFSKEYEEASAQLNDAYYALEDVSYRVGSMADGLEYDEREVDKVEDRLYEIGALKRKYGQDVKTVLAYLDQAKQELQRLNQGEKTLADMVRRESACQKELEKACQALSEKRQTVAKEFCKNVLAHLSDLNMAKTRFEAQFTRIEAGANGWDSVCFLIAPNPGEPLKPFAKISSGGELSRMMLALKSITAQKDNIGTMIFDEIDTGISGKVAMAVAQKLRAIAKDRQVLCITHLAPIAVMGDRHFLIEKQTDEERTTTQVTLLGEEARVAEIARLAGGSQTPAAFAHAKELLRQAHV